MAVPVLRSAGSGRRRHTQSGLALRRPLLALKCSCTRPRCGAAPWAGASRRRWSARRNPRRLRGCRLASASSGGTQPQRGKPQQSPGASLALPSPGFCAGPRGSGSAWRPHTCELWSEHGAACHASPRRVSAAAVPVDAEHHLALIAPPATQGPAKGCGQDFKTATAPPKLDHLSCRRPRRRNGST